MAHTIGLYFLRFTEPSDCPGLTRAAAELCYRVCGFLSTVENEGHRDTELSRNIAL
jgi:hypothetical protein